MDNRKYIGILIIFFGLAALAVIIYFLFFYKAKIEPVIPEQVQETQKVIPKTISEEKKEEKKAVITIMPKREFGEIDLKILAASFAERFGSFSNQSDFGNIRDLKILMSQRMADWVDTFIQGEIAKKTSSSIYYGITTKAVFENVKEFDTTRGTASVLVSTQRKESTGTTNNSTKFAQDILLNFVRKNGVWKIDSAYWQDK